MKTPTLRVWIAAPALWSLAAGAATAAGPAVEKVTVRAVAHFAFNGIDIDSEDRERLLAEVGVMKDVTWQTVTATGYTDDVGSARYNVRLGKRRANVVKTYLTGKGLPTTLVQTASKGEASPVADNDTDQGRAQNRRTEVLFEGVRAAVN